MSENFPNFMETINLYIEEAPQILKHRKFEETQHWSTLLKNSDKEKILKIARGKKYAAYRVRQEL